MGTKRAKAKKSEIGVCDAADRPLQLNSGSQQSQNKDKPFKSSSGVQRLAEHHKYANKQKVVSPAGSMDQLHSVWNSLSLEKKKSFLKVSVSELKEHLDLSKDDSVKKVLSEALSFVQSNRKWTFWLCCSCSCSCNDKLPCTDYSIINKFRDRESHIEHVWKEHIGELRPELQQILPQEVDSHWAKMLLECEWKPVEVSDAVIMIEDQLKGQDVVPVDSSDVGNHAGSSKEDSIIDDFCSKDASDSCLDEEKTEPSPEESKGVDNECIIENRDHDDISNVEVMKFESIQWSNVYSLARSWPLSSDSERIDLLKRIHDMFKRLLTHKYLATSELTKVIKYTVKKLQGLDPKSQLLNHCLSKTPLGICFLEASQLKEVLKQLQDYCKYGGFRFVDETHTDTQNSEFSERVVLIDGFLHLLLDDRLLCNPGRYSEKSSISGTDATETSVLPGDCEGGVFADGNALLSSIFTGSTSAEQWVSWKRLKEEKIREGMDVFHRLEKEFSNLERFCEKKFIYLRYAKALEGMKGSEAGLLAQQLVEKDTIGLKAILTVLKDAASKTVFGEGPNDTSIEKSIQMQKNKYSAKHVVLQLSEMDANIMRTFTVRQQLELQLGSLSSHDYQTLILSFVKTLIQASLKRLAEEDATEKSEAVREAFLAELELEENKSLSKGGHHSKIQEKSKNEKKKNKKKNKNKNNKMKDSEVAGGSESLVPYEETAEQCHDILIASHQDSSQKFVAFITKNGMGAGGKHQRLSLAEIDQQSSNSDENYRNLGENDLGGVIFGCTNFTKDECLLNKIFGLPSQHFTYIKNIGLGLPLFLFNYSDRKLHGIFEATSQGQMNLNPHAWGVDGSETQFPAQVPFDFRTECQPLPEELFMPKIIKNYYAENRFKFELDHDQASDLISLFKSSLTRGGTSTVSMVPKDACIYESKDSLASISKVDTDAPSAYLEAESGFPNDTYKSKSTDPDPDPDPNARNEQGVKTVEFPCLDPSSISVNEENQMLESHSEKEEVTCPNINVEEGVVDVPHEKNDTALEEEDDCSPEAALVSSPDHKYEDISINNSSNLQSLVNQLRQENGKLKDLLAEKERKWVESEFQVQQLQDQLHQRRAKQLESQLSTSIREPFDNELRLGVDQLIFMLGGSDGFSWSSGYALHCYSPSRDIMKSLRPMCCARSSAASATLYGQIYVFGGALTCINSLYNTVESYNPLGNEWTFRPSLRERKEQLAGVTLHNNIYAIGGMNKINCLSDVEMFDPYTGRWTLAPPMCHKRSCAAAVELNGVIYVFGGHDGIKYLKSAERFDPREASWSLLQDMNTMRGWHSSAVLNEKIYAVGGFDGYRFEVLPTVEVFDPRMGTWIQGDKMKEPRTNFSVAVLGETIYAWGGRRGPHATILSETVECYKEGQGWQITNLKGVGPMCSFTSVVL